jgi:hypothetical protein
VGTTAVTVAVSFLNGSGTTTSPASDTCASGGGTLAPGETCYGALDAAGSQLARCSVDASSSKIRAALMLVRTGDTVLSVPATKK